jgi:hypothetical protein
VRSVSLLCMSDRKPQATKDPRVAQVIPSHETLPCLLVMTLHRPSHFVAGKESNLYHQGMEDKGRLLVVCDNHSGVHEDPEVCGGCMLTDVEEVGVVVTSQYHVVDLEKVLSSGIDIERMEQGREP